MTNRSIEVEAALRLALEAMQQVHGDYHLMPNRLGPKEAFDLMRKAITAAQKALAQPALASEQDCTRSHPHENMSKECELRTEIARLTNCLARANAQAEHFEREWYLRGDELERLKAQPEQREPVAWLDPQGNVTQIPFSKRYRGYTPLYAGASPTQCLHCLQRSKDEL